jgi:hypothetical protein
MHAAPLAFGNFDWALEAKTDRPSAPAIAEIHALREIDLITPPEWIEAEPTPLMQSGEIAAGDHLRLPPPAMRDGPAIQGSVGRILAIDTQRGGDTKEVVEKEESMRRLLKALHHANHEIRRLAR